MPKRKIFYSFHFDNDVFRVQQVRNIGSLEDNKPVSENRWEKVKLGGSDAIKKWINDTLADRSCLVVLIGEETAGRKWVKYEIKRAWNLGKGVVGIYIHNLKCPNQGYCSKGSNPFHQFELGDKKLSSIVKCYNPKGESAYKRIKQKMTDWVEEAIEIRNNYD